MLIRNDKWDWVKLIGNRLRQMINEQHRIGFFVSFNREPIFSPYCIPSNLTQNEFIFKSEKGGIIEGHIFNKSENELNIEDIYFSLRNLGSLNINLLIFHSIGGFNRDVADQIERNLVQREFPNIQRVGIIDEIRKLGANIDLVRWGVNRL